MACIAVKAVEPALLHAQPSLAATTMFGESWEGWVGVREGGAVAVVLYPHVEKAT